MRIKYLLIYVFTLFFSISYGQSDTSKIYNCKQLKKGFYKNYQEYINNAPSIVLPFSVVPLSKSKTDTTIIRADFLLPDDLEHIGFIWGFCDGDNVYVHYPNSIFNGHYWKLECVGRFPFFTYKHKNIHAIGPGLFALITVAATAAAAAEYDLIVINENGKYKDPTFSQMKKLLATQPDLLKSFKEQIEKYRKYDDPYSDQFNSDQILTEETAIIKDYLLKLNEAAKIKNK